MKHINQTNYKITELAKIYKVSRPTIYRWMKNKDFVEICQKYIDTKLMSQIEIMEMFHASRPTFNKWKRSKNFPKAVKVSDRDYWIFDELIAWANRHREGGDLYGEIF